MSANYKNRSDQFSGSIIPKTLLLAGAHTAFSAGGHFMATDYGLKGQRTFRMSKVVSDLVST